MPKLEEILKDIKIQEENPDMDYPFVNSDIINYLVEETQKYNEESLRLFVTNDTSINPAETHSKMVEFVKSLSFERTASVKSYFNSKLSGLQSFSELPDFKDSRFVNAMNLNLAKNVFNFAVLQKTKEILSNETTDESKSETKGYLALFNSEEYFLTQANLKGYEQNKQKSKNSLEADKTVETLFSEIESEREKNYTYINKFNNESRDITESDIDCMM